MSIADNIADIQNRISKAASLYGVADPATQLIAVSKKQPDERIDEALQAGQRIFGENRVQEAMERWSGRRAQFPDLELHLIGPLQTNKVKEAVGLFDVIQTLDREKLARALDKEMKAQGRVLPCLVQVNTGEEEQKSGILPGKVSDFLTFCRAETGLDIRGLMCIPPVDEPAGLHFALLKKLADEHGLEILSMGMSADFEKAVPLGARYIRVGTSVFGERAY